MNKTFIFLITLFLNFSALAEDIKELEIEGISIGDNLLSYFDENEIKKKFFYKTNKYYAFTSSKFSSENYDGIQFHVKNNDKKFQIVAIEGMKLFEDITECKKLKKKIVNELSSQFKNALKQDDQGNHVYDSTGNSKYFRTAFYTNPKDKWNSIEVACFDWSKELENQFGDKLTVGIKTQTFQTWMAEEAYK